MATAGNKLTISRSDFFFSVQVVVSLMSSCLMWTTKIALWE